MSKKKTKTNRFIYLLGICFISSTMPKSQMPCTNISINFIYFFLLSQDFFEPHFSNEYWIQLQKLLDICVCKCSRACVCARSIVCKKRATPGHNFIYNLFCCCCCYFCLFFFPFFSLYEFAHSLALAINIAFMEHTWRILMRSSLYLSLSLGLNIGVQFG